MLVVSDTSSLNYLVLIGLDHILPALFGRVLTTPAVMGELTHSDAPEPVRRWAEPRPRWLEVRSPAALLPGIDLDIGETEAISLAKEISADSILLDERIGSAVARALGLNVTGTLGVLVRAAQLELIALPKAIESLRSTTFRADDALFERLLRQDAARRAKP